MGIINVTPDSFSDGGLHATAKAAIERGLAMVHQGATFVDVGGESTRPGASPLDIDVELQRVLPVIRALATQTEALISVDTRKPEVAHAAVVAGAHIVNDICGLRSPEMVATCAELGVPVIIMHMQGTPETMQLHPAYDDVVGEVTAWLEQQAEMALAAGVAAVVIDPGIGFGKTSAHNLDLLRALPLTTRYPVLVGASRKRFIGTITGVEIPSGRDPGSVSAHLWAMRHGAAIVRVHDVAAQVQAFAVEAALNGSGPELA